MPPAPPADVEADAAALPIEEPARKAIVTTTSTPWPWIGPVLAAALLLLLVLALLDRPGSYLLPFPWQEAQRTTTERQIRQTLFAKIDRAATTYFLMEKKYPTDLNDLVGRGLLADADTRAPSGNALRISSQDLESYRIELLGPEGEVVETRTSVNSDDLIIGIPGGVLNENPLFLLD